MNNLYVKVDNLLDKTTCEILAGGLLIREFKTPLDKFKVDRQTPGAYWSYGYTATDSLLCYLRPKMEEITGKKLLPTYSYARVYRNGNSLWRHIDRPECEFSVTITLKTDGTPWPIIMGDKEIYIEQGSGVVYQGEKIRHERKPYDGNEHVQCFLHYVDANGSYKDNEFDKRLDIIDPFC
jgi:hypothetical protein